MDLEASQDAPGQAVCSHEWLCGVLGSDGSWRGSWFAMPESQAEPPKECLLGSPVSSHSLSSALKAALDSGGVMPLLCL